MSVALLEELERIAEALENENNTEQLVQLSKQLLTTLDRVEALKSKSESAA
jgi:hypothetical protein